MISTVEGFARLPPTRGPPFVPSRTTRGPLPAEAAAGRDGPALSLSRWEAHPVIALGDRTAINAAEATNRRRPCEGTSARIGHDSMATLLSFADTAASTR